MGEIINNFRKEKRNITTAKKDTNITREYCKKILC